MKRPGARRLVCVSVITGFLNHGTSALRWNQAVAGIAPHLDCNIVHIRSDVRCRLSAPELLESYLGGRWSRGEGVETELVDPVTGDLLATVSARGLALKAALTFARARGGPALRSLGFAERAKLLGTVADVLAANRPRYEAIAVANSGNTKSDAAIDIDGGIGTLKYYARLGATLGDARLLVDDKPVRLTKAENYQALHVLSPRRGVAIHINAFNFPS